MDWTSSFSLSRLRSCFSQVRYRAEWSNEMAFRSILISPKMLTDHMPDAVLRALNSLTSERPFLLCPSALNDSQHNTVWNLAYRGGLLILYVKPKLFSLSWFLSTKGRFEHFTCPFQTLSYPKFHHENFGPKPDYEASQAFTLELDCEI